MAMVVGCGYEEAYESFDDRTESANTYSMEKFLNKHGLSIYARNQNRDAEEVAWLLNCSSPSGAHWIVMDTDGTIYDPSPTPLKRYKHVDFYSIKPMCK
nr:hypothetical protein 43 [Balneolaceae bacterium]